MVPQTGPESPSHGPQPNTRASLEITTALSRSGSRYSLKKWQALQRRASTPNLSRPATGLDDSTEDEAPSRPLTRFSTDDWRSRDRKSHQQGFQPFVLGHDQQPYLDSPLPMTPSMSPFQSTTTGADDKSPRGSFDRRPGSPRASLERTVSPFDTNGGEFKQLDPESLRPHKAAAPKGYVPPPHALPMELVLLQTFNDSDHLPEHHEWTQDESYWYYVTKAHGVRRRKLKKVSTWWLDMGSLGSVLLSGSSSSSSEPIATGPIYNMGHSTGSSTPNPSSSPLSSEVALSSGRQTPILGQEPSTTSSGLIRKQSSPRNSSHMGKYYAVDWEEYIST
ncbi:hypothetical protein BGX31_006967 [Mortierella sp. GBA43]|nr:hypothetical protein BGX31_006967 [Mortierella sp. GBA43]